MKKLLSAVTAALTCSALLSSMSINAVENKPELYFRAEENQNVTVGSDGNLYISKDDLKENDVTLDINLYVKDDAQSICNLYAKWQSDSKYVQLQNLINPKQYEQETETEYTTSDGKTFKTKMLPFCYSEIKSDGTLKIPYIVETFTLTDENRMGLSVYTNSISNNLSILGASSDEYAYAQFQAVVDSDTPEGTYEIYLNTKENTEYNGNNITISYISDEDGKKSDYFPEACAMSITVYDSTEKPTQEPTEEPTQEFMLGDVDDDGYVNAVDASLVLSAYAMTATQQPHDLTEIQQTAADVNNDGAIDAVDASQILSYYAYTATGGKDSSKDFFGKNQ